VWRLGGSIHYLQPRQRISEVWASHHFRPYALDSSRVTATSFSTSHGTGPGRMDLPNIRHDTSTLESAELQRDSLGSSWSLSEDPQVLHNSQVL